MHKLNELVGRSCRLLSNQSWKTCSCGMDLQKVSRKTVKISGSTYFSERLTILTNREKIIFHTLMY